MTENTTDDAPAAVPDYDPEDDAHDSSAAPSGNGQADQPTTSEDADEVEADIDTEDDSPDDGQDTGDERKSENSPENLTEDDPEVEDETAPENEEAARDNDETDDEPEDDADESDSEDDDADDLLPDANGVTPLPISSVVEAVLFAAREPLRLAQIARAVGKRTRQDAVREAIDELNVQYLETARAFEIAEISGRYQLMSRPEYAEHIMRIYPKRELTDKDKSHRLTPAALDTLAIIAYKQPVMRSEIEHIRGVACGPVLKALIERGSVREVGRRADLVGKPAVFGTTERFLAEFGLGSLDELPLRNEFQTLPGMEPPVEMTLIQPESESEADDVQATDTVVEPVTAAEALPMAAGPVELRDDDVDGEEEVDILATLPNGENDETPEELEEPE